MLDPKRLRLLVAVADHGSVSQAALALSYSGSSVSEQIAALEREAGTTLLERGARGVTLTEPGRILVEHGRRVLDQLRAAEEDLRATTNLERGLVRLGFFATAGALLVPAAVTELRRRHPAIEVQLVEADPREAMTMLNNRALDLTLVYRYPFEELDVVAGVELTTLLDDEVVLMLTHDHPLARRRRILLADLVGHDIIQGVAAGTPNAAIPQACRIAGFEPQITFSTSDHTTVQGLAAAGVGVAFTSQLSLPAVRSDLTVRRLQHSALRRRVFVAARPRTGPAVPAMTAAIVDAAQNLKHEIDHRLNRPRS
jgi:DNA-binding transcriptional LysR family regulator